MIRTIKSIISIILILGSSCNNTSKTHLRVDSKEILNRSNLSLVKGIHNDKVKLSFFDSVLSKSDLSISQIKQHTIIDTLYINQNTRFVGDTLYKINSNCSVALVKAYGPTCGYKYLLVFNHFTLKNTAYRLILTDCDEDEGADFSRLRYNTITDTTFYTNETLLKRKINSKIHVVVNKQYYGINKKGEIDSLRPRATKSY